MMTSAPSDELSIATLRAMHFANLSRCLICGYCQHSPERHAKLLSNLPIIRDETIEAVALPFFKELVSMPQARAALTFFSSVEGGVIGTKMLESDPPRLSPSELKALDDFGRSPAGLALQRFLGNPQVLPAIETAIAHYVP